MIDVICYKIEKDGEEFSSCSLSRIERKLEGYRVAFMTTQEQDDYKELLTYGDAILNGHQVDNPRISALNEVLGEM